MTRPVRARLALATLAALALTLAGCAGGGGEAPRFRLAPVERLGETSRTAEATDAAGSPTTGSTKLPPARSLTRPSRLAAAEDPAQRFDVARAMSDVRVLASFGPRGGGSAAEAKAATYIERRLEGMGYEADVQTFELPTGRTSRNVTARLPGHSSRRAIVLGAHFDTKPPSPGANDNASGCAVVLELARLLKDSPLAGEVLFVFYGTEEYVDESTDSHHLGSRHHAAGMTAEQVANTAAMLSVDMVGYGSEFKVRTMRRGPQSLSDHLLAEGRRRGVPLGFEADPGATGWSDHEPYELRGIPVAWLQWQRDPTYHTAGDVASHVDPKRVETTGQFLLDVLRDLDAAKLEEFCRR